MKNLFRKINSSQKAFSLVEIMVAMSILAIIVIVMSQLLATSASAINGSGKYMTADGEARQIFNRMEVDFSGILKRNDVDVVFYKPELGGSSATVGPNDALYFYSQAPAYFSTTDTPNSSPIALLGYRIDSTAVDKDYQQLERLGQGLTWDNGSSTTTGGLVFLTWDPSNGFSSSSLLSSWNSVGMAPYNVASTLSTTPTNLGASYEVMGADVFRFEVCFALKDGSYSDCPVLSIPPSTWSTGYTFFTASSSSPTPSCGQSGSGTSGYTTGSRWYNTQTGESFICTNATSNNAVWAGAGVQDISAIIVTLAILDNTSRQMIPSTTLTLDLNTIAGEFADSGLGYPGALKTPTLPASVWNNYIINNMSTMPVPKPVAAKIRIYQRAFYLKTESIGQ